MFFLEKNKKINDVNSNMTYDDMLNYLNKDSMHELISSSQVNLLPFKKDLNNNFLIYTSCKTYPKINLDNEIHLFFPKNSGNIILLSKTSYDKENFQQVKPFLIKTHNHVQLDENNKQITYKGNDLMEFISSLNDKFDDKNNWFNKSYILTDEILLTQLNAKPLENHLSHSPITHYNVDFNISNHDNIVKLLDSIWHKHTTNDKRNDIEYLVHNQIFSILNKYTSMKATDFNKQRYSYIGRKDKVFHETQDFLKLISPFYIKYSDRNFKPITYSAIVDICLPQNDVYLIKNNENHDFIYAAFQPSMLQINESYVQIRKPSRVLF